MTFAAILRHDNPSQGQFRPSSRIGIPISEAKAIEIQALAQADAYQQIAAQIGSSIAPLIEVLKIVGERGIEITPRVMVSGGAGGNGASQTTALIGTVLDTMVDRTQTQPATTQPAAAARQTAR